MRYRPDLDGLRAVAVLLVLAGHASWPVPNDGGTVGVTAFFVLSGYLITGLLIAERDRTGRVVLADFYRRRARRLVPTLVVVIVACSLLTLGGSWQPAPMLTGAVAALTWATNWFSTSVDPGPLGHTWSLAIEGQFYLVWAPIIAFMPRRARFIALLGIAVAVLARLLVFDPVTAYFATATRMDALFVGCLCALLGIRLHRRAGVIGVLVILAAAMLAGRVSDQIVLPVAIAGAAIICTSEWTSIGVLSPIGRRAYGLYLWNWPMVLLFPSGPAVVMTFATAELSHRLVERRWLRPRSSREPGVAEPGAVPPPRIVAAEPAPSLA
jgi:peptidoglycan/LPS O-acetylase OafA/YrhL